MGCNCNKTKGSKCNCGSGGGVIGGNWMIPVTTVPPIELANRKNAYILPDDSVYIVNYKGDALVPLTVKQTCSIIWANDALPSVEDAEPCSIYMQDNKAYILSEDKTAFQLLFSNTEE